MKTLFQIFSSLRLTVFLLIAAMILVFWGTLEQVHLGIHAVQARYFASWVAFFPIGPRAMNAANGVFYFPWLGGYLLGVLFLINLACAHVRYFRASFKKIGIVLIHAGIAALSISGFISGILQEEAQMTIDEGQHQVYAESFEHNELVVIDITDPLADVVCSIRSTDLRVGEAIALPLFDLSITPVAFYENAKIMLRSQVGKEHPQTLATRGAALKMDIVAIPEPPTYKQGEFNAVTGFIQVRDGQGEDVGTWLVSNVIDERFPQQTFEENGRSYAIALRFKRYYYPFSFELKKFTHTKYPGSDIPKSFVSELILKDVQKADRSVIISMNVPLRYGGWSFYQASFANGDKTTILQAVRNPGWLLPYFSVILVAMGLFVHFAIRLVASIRRIKK
jgi:hypothetical protein